MLNSLLTSIIKSIKSRTVITILVIVATNIVNAFAQYLTPEQMALITAILSALAVYYRINPQAKF